MSKTIEMTIAGMHCNGCALGTQGALERLPQVISAKVSFADKQAVVEVEEAAYDESALRQAVKNAGFEVMEIK